MSEPVGPDKLAKFLERNAIPKSKAAEALGVSHVAVLNWTTRRASPTPERRKAIEVWTAGDVAEADWLTDKERDVAAKLDAVEPFVPPAANRGDAA